MLVGFLSIGFSSCSSDDGNASGTTSKKVREALLASQWEIGSLIINEAGEPNQNLNDVYDDYRFTFSDPNTVTFANASSQETTTFSIPEQASWSYGHLGFHLRFSETGEFAFLGQNWIIQKMVNNQIFLRFIDQDGASGVMILNKI